MPKRIYLPHLLAVAIMIATPAVAADQPVWPLLPAALPTKAAPLPEVDYFAPRPVPAWQLEFAARYWYGNANTGKSLYDVPSSSDALVSRLTYSGMDVNAGELFGRVAFTSGWFIKGYVGAGALWGGSLKDEDFPPFIVPYSSTNSDQRDGSIAYASADLGYNVIRGGDFRVGAFAGYHYFREIVNAFGCTQTTSNPDICQPPVPTLIEVITQNNNWQSLRIGLDGSLRLAERFTLNADAAWLPLVWLNGTDAHWLRIGTGVGDFTGPIPEDGRGQGFQLEALLSYQVTQYASVGIGARYWHMQTNGDTHFENHIVGETAFPQPVDWKTDIYGVFIQASLKLGPYPLGRLN
ncbi:MAG TPA: autotransporter outer membrane beta-barrel domain-containing protein [Xanthobacteraceae bacterium]|nr:autotransporter outer membrane beta-barrel domain-containing protein [Xanthobacteraceae bacterium]